MVLIKSKVAEIVHICLLTMHDCQLSRDKTLTSEGSMLLSVSH